MVLTLNPAQHTDSTGNTMLWRDLRSFGYGPIREPNNDVFDQFNR